MNVNSNRGGFPYGMQKKKELMKRKQDIPKQIENQKPSVEQKTDISTNGPKLA